MDNDQVSYATLLKKLDYSVKLVNLLIEQMRNPNENTYEEISKTLKNLPDIKIIKIGIEKSPILMIGDLLYKDFSFTIFAIRRKSIYLYFSPFLLYIDTAISGSEKFLYEIFKSSNRKRTVINNTLERLHTVYPKIISIIQEGNMLSPIFIIRKRSFKIKKHPSQVVPFIASKKYFLNVLYILSSLLRDIIRIHRSFYISIFL